MVSDRTFKLNMCIPWCNSFSLLPRSRSPVEVKYQGRNSHCSGICVSQTYLVYLKNFFAYTFLGHTLLFDINNRPVVHLVTLSVHLEKKYTFFFKDWRFTPFSVNTLPYNLGLFQGQVNTCI